MSRSKLKLIFDISVLGMGTKNPTARTGVFRAIENLFSGFINHPDIFLSLNTKPQYMNATKYYLGQKGLLSIENSRQDASITERKGLLQKLFRRKAKHGIEIKHSLRLYADDLVKADIFHSPWLPVPKAYAKSKKVRRFITVYDLIPVLFPDFVTKANVNQFKKNLNSITPETWVICISNSTKNDLVNYHNNLNPEKVFVTHLAASELFYPVKDGELLKQVRKKYNIPESPYILTVATIEPRKNIRAVLYAFRDLILQEKISDLNLVLAGIRGWKYQEVVDFIETSPDLSSRVFYTGYIHDNDLAAIYSGAATFVYPSLYEGFGLPPLEAMQCGVPVICSKTSSLPEVVGNAGIMVAPNDTQELSSSIMKIYTDNSLKQQLSQKALNRSKKFHWSKCIHETIKVYQFSSEQD
jgi:glycosyltransferase involved in cell wall biosynthesis